MSRRVYQSLSLRQAQARTFTYLVIYILSCLRLLGQEEKHIFCLYCTIGTVNNTSKHLKEQIEIASHQVDTYFVNAASVGFSQYASSLPVPSHHSRATIGATQFVVKPLTKEDFLPNSYFIVSSSLQDTFISDFMGDKCSFIQSSEKGLKDSTWLDEFIHTTVSEKASTIVGIGGGAILNAAAYIAEKQHMAFISIPTTVLAAADAAIGGLIRLDRVQEGKVEKNFYKSVYEPNDIFVDVRFLHKLPKSQIAFGCSEIVKHGVYQSAALLEYLASEAFDPFNNINALIKAICWTVALKNVVITYDPESLSFGGDILRGGHTVARDIEERLEHVSHGEAVAIGVYQDINDTQVCEQVERVYQKLHLPRAEAELHVSTY